MTGPRKTDRLFAGVSDALAIPLDADRRAFLMRNAAIGAAAVMTGSAWSPEARAQQAATEASAQRAAREAAKDEFWAQDERRPFPRLKRG